MMTLHDVKQFVNELSNAEKLELRDYLDVMLVDVAQHPSDELSEREQFRQMLGNILVHFENPPPLLSDEEEEAMMKMVHEAFAGQPPLSDDIIAEREDRI